MAPPPVPWASAMSAMGSLVAATMGYSTLSARRRRKGETRGLSGGLGPDAYAYADYAQPVPQALRVISAIQPIARLLHKIQMERGHTVCCVGSRGAVHGCELAAARARTDAELEHLPPAQRMMLRRLRESADRDLAADADEPVAVGIALYGALMGYTSLLEHIHSELGTFPVCTATFIFSAFASLKCVIAQIRAIVAGAIVLSNDAFASVSDKMRADLVVLLHRRRAYARAIRHQAPRHLLRLLSAGLEVSLPLAGTLDKLESLCSLAALRGELTLDEWWGTVSTYIDVLDRLLFALLAEFERTAHGRAEALEYGRRSPRLSGECDTFEMDHSAASSCNSESSSSPVLRLKALGIRRSGYSGIFSAAPPSGELRMMPSRESSLAASSARSDVQPGDAYARLFGMPHEFGGRTVSQMNSSGGSPAASTNDQTRWKLLNAAALLTLGRAGVHGSVGGAASLSEWLHATPAEALKSALCRMVDARAMLGDAPSPVCSLISGVSPKLSPRVSRAASMLHRQGQPPYSPTGVHSTSPRQNGPAGDPESEHLSLDGTVHIQTANVLSSAAPAADGRSDVTAVRAAEPELGAWLIELHELLFEHRIGVGGAGATYLATWKGAQVAVKVAGGVGSSRWLEAWRAEVTALTQLRHPNVVEYMGCVVEPPTYCLVLEYCRGGDLYQALREPTPPGLTMKVLRGVAAGMAYLHSRCYMHRDLKSSNVLLDGSGEAKLMDFGLSRRLDPQAAEAMTAETGTYRWMAPEIIRHESYTESADVFSYGMLGFELLTHEVREPGKRARMARLNRKVFGDTGRSFIGHAILVDAQSSLVSCFRYHTPTDLRFRPPCALGCKASALLFRMAHHQQSVLS